MTSLVCTRDGRVVQIFLKVGHVTVTIPLEGQFIFLWLVHGTIHLVTVPTVKRLDWSTTDQRRTESRNHGRIHVWRDAPPNSTQYSSVHVRQGRSGGTYQYIALDGFFTVRRRRLYITKTRQLVMNRSIKFKLYYDTYGNEWDLPIRTNRLNFSTLKFFISHRWRTKHWLWHIVTVARCNTNTNTDATHYCTFLVPQLGD